MGSCCSCGKSTAATVTPLNIVKVVTEHGSLLEFSNPITAAEALKNCRTNSFICSADDLEFNGVVFNLSPEEELQLGQLYFVLPRSMIGRTMQSGDMAKLVARASDALKSSTDSDSSAPLVFPEADRSKTTCSSERLRLKSRKKKSSGSERSFASELSSIQEE